MGLLLELKILRLVTLPYVETSECKAAKRHGSMPILVPKTLYKLMIDYCCEIYPFFKRLQLKNAKSDDERRQYQKIQLEDYVFPSDRGARMDRISRIIETLKRFEKTRRFDIVI